MASRVGRAPSCYGRVVITLKGRMQLGAESRRAGGRASSVFARGCRRSSVAGFALWLGACGGAEPSDSSLSIPFAVEVAGQPFVCGASYQGVGTDQQAFTAFDLRFYVHGASLSDRSGQRHALALHQDGVFQVDNLALLDFEGDTPECDTGTPQTNRELVGSLPAGSYRGLTFRLGVPFARNHADQTLAPSPLNLTSMFWTWRDGYKFLRLDGETEQAGFIVHLGSTGCDGSLSGGTQQCSAPNIVEVSLPDYEPGQRVVLDLAHLLAGSALMNLSAEDAGCMSAADDPQCAPIFERLGLQSPAVPQAVFHAE
jgi:uncharacterized repeat protein (TIGR04052 family)